MTDTHSPVLTRNDSRWSLATEATSSALERQTSAAKHYVRDALLGDEQIEPEENWGKLRRAVAMLISSNLYTAFEGVVIGINLVFVLIEADRRAKCEDAESDACSANKWDVTYPDRACLGFYCANVLLKIYVLQCKYWVSFQNIADFFVVGLSLAGEVLGNVLANAALLRLIRVIRVVRVLRLLTTFQELYLIVAAFASTMRTIAWACLLLMLLMAILAIGALEVLNPAQEQLIEWQKAQGLEVCDRCPEAFASVSSWMVSLFGTLFMGDNIFDLFVPLIESDWKAACFIFFSIALVYLGFSNLILSVIVENANDARINDRSYQKMVQKKQQGIVAKELMVFWRELDTEDGSTVSIEEIRSIWSTSQRFRDYFQEMDVDKEYLTHTLSLMVNHRSHHRVEFKAFVDTVLKFRDRDAGVIALGLKFQMSKVLRDLAELKVQLGEFQNSPVGNASHGMGLQSQQGLHTPRQETSWAPPSGRTGQPEQRLLDIDTEGHLLEIASSPRPPSSPHDPPREATCGVDVCGKQGLPPWQHDMVEVHLDRMMRMPQSAGTDALVEAFNSATQVLNIVSQAMSRMLPQQLHPRSGTTAIAAEDILIDDSSDDEGETHHRSNAPQQWADEEKSAGNVSSLINFDWMQLRPRSRVSPRNVQTSTATSRDAPVPADVSKDSVTEEILVDAFKVFDHNRNGHISASELRYVLTHFGEKLSEEEVDLLIQDAFVDGDGQIKYEEFVQTLYSQREL